MELFNWLMVTLAAIPRDLKMSVDHMESIGWVNYWWWRDYKVYELFDQVAAEKQHEVAFRVGYETWTFHMLQEYSKQVANYFHTAGLERGDIVAQAGVEGPRAVALWLGLSRLGVATAILPPDLPPATMVQLSSSVFSKAIICHPNLVQGLNQEALPDYMTVLSTEQTQDKNVKHLKEELAAVPSKGPKKAVKTSVEDMLLYLFSPDTQKPMPVTNYRYIFIATTLHMTLDLEEKDVLYSPLPQDTPEGSIVAAGQALIFGNTVVTRKTSAANSYFRGCNHYDATVALYNEEIIQTLLSAPPSAYDNTHKVRLAVGKGLKDPQALSQFKDRFRVERIGEFYSSANSKEYNMGYMKDNLGYYLLVDTIAENVRKEGSIQSLDSSSKSQDMSIKSKTSEHVEEVQTQTEVKKEVDEKESQVELPPQPIHDHSDHSDEHQPQTEPQEPKQQPEEPNHQPEEPKQQPEEPKEQLEEPKQQPEEPKQQPEEPKPHPEEPKQQPEEPKQQLEEPKQHPEEPKPQPEESKPQSEEPKPQSEQPVPQPEKPKPLHTEMIEKPTPHTQPQPNQPHHQQPQPHHEEHYFNLEEKFHEVETAVREKSHSLPQDKRLALYGLARQATTGNVNTSRPSSWLSAQEQLDMWDAWNSYKGKTRPAAMKEFITLARSCNIVVP